MSESELSLSGRTQAAFVDFRGRERASIFFKRGREMEYIRRGMTFRRVRPDNCIETARVLSVVLDGVQIPHVRFEINLERSNRGNAFCEGPRILALSAFTETYRERV